MKSKRERERDLAATLSATKKTRRKKGNAYPCLKKLPQDSSCRQREVNDIMVRVQRHSPSPPVIIIVMMIPDLNTTYASNLLSQKEESRK